MIFKDKLKPGDRQYIVIIALYYYTQIFAASIISISTSKLNLFNGRIHEAIFQTGQLFFG